MELLYFIKKYYTLVFVWAACLTAILRYSRYWARQFRWFVVFITMMALEETVGNYMAFKRIPNHFYFNIYFIIQFVVVPCFFYKWLYSSAFKKVVRIYLFIFPFFVLADIIWLQEFSNLLTYTIALGGSFIFLLSLAYIRQLYASEEINSVWHYPVFWISLAYLFYYTFAIPYLGKLNYLWIHDSEVTKKLYIVYNLGIILHSIFLVIGFLCLNPTSMKRSLH
ncbi:MAG: hypothetical protein M3342_08890 [Bacteroidota bacterium]|nr:hypothetical protein [Bacteroidota bacterium]